jgi:preprotein translocase subunit SecG
MFVFFTIVHILLCVFMIFVILLQPGKDAGMGAALGGGAATSAFGGRGAATFLTKLTAFCAIGFFITSLGLSFVGLRSSAVEGLGDEPAAAVPANTNAPAVPAPGAAPSTPTEAAPAPAAAPAENTGTANDAVPADKLPAK